MTFDIADHDSEQVYVVVGRSGNFLGVGKVKEPHLTKGEDENALQRKVELFPHTNLLEGKQYDSKKTRTQFFLDTAITKLHKFLNAAKAKVFKQQVAVVEHTVYGSPMSLCGASSAVIPNIKTITFSYDGGRIGVDINGEPIYYTLCGGIDGEVVVTLLGPDNAK